LTGFGAGFPAWGCAALRAACTGRVLLVFDDAHKLSEPRRLEALARFVAAADADQPWTDYTVTNKLSGKTYRVTLRGFELGDSYCSCPDYRTNTVGKCKHVMKVSAIAKRKFPPERLRRRFRPSQLAVHLHYAGEVTLRLMVPDRLDDEAAEGRARCRSEGQALKMPPKALASPPTIAAHAVGTRT